jgi:tight adherence protein C
MVTIILISTFICIAGAVMAIYWLLFRPVSATAQRLSELDEGRAGIIAPSIEVNGMETMAARLAEPINKLVPPSAASAKKLQRELMQAGYRSPAAPAIYRVSQLFSMLFFPTLIVFVWTVVMVHPLNDALLPALFAFGAGFLLPRFILNRKVANRKLRITWGLADALDLMVITMEAGLGLNAAMLRVCEELRPVHPDINICLYRGRCDGALLAPLPARQRNCTTSERSRRKQSGHCGPEHRTQPDGVVGCSFG